MHTFLLLFVCTPVGYYSAYEIKHFYSAFRNQHTTQVLFLYTHSFHLYKKLTTLAFCSPILKQFRLTIHQAPMGPFMTWSGFQFDRLFNEESLFIGVMLSMRAASQVGGCQATLQFDLLVNLFLSFLYHLMNYFNVWIVALQNGR